MMFAAITGLRPKELRELRFKQHLVKMSESKYCLRIEKHKTAKMTLQPKPRSVPLSGVAMEIVERQRAAHKDSEYIFLNEDGIPYPAGSFRRRLERWCDRAGIERKSPYALRHYFGTILATEKNLNQSVLAQLMGHSKLQTTDRCIANASEHHKESIDFTSEKLTNLLNIANKATVEDPQKLLPKLLRGKKGK